MQPTLALRRLPSIVGPVMAMKGDFTDIMFPADFPHRLPTVSLPQDADDFLYTVSFFASCLGPPP